MFEVYGEPPRTAALFVNAKSRRGEELFTLARQQLKDRGLHLVEASSFTHNGDLQEAVKRQIDAGTPLIITGGGDGTMSSVAHLFAHQKAVLGVLPLGTGNAFARDLGLNGELDHACEAIVNGKVASVDMGLIGDRQFLNVATVGLTTLIACGLNPHLKRAFGKAVYVVSILGALSRLQPFMVKLQLPDGLESFECLQLVIGNGRFHAGPFPISPDATITGGFLAVYALATKNRSSFVRFALHMVNGTHVGLSDVKYFRVQSGILDTAPSQEITVDGEICFRTPRSFSMAERALHVVVPQEFNG
jgi:diacylglycerol kinase (ATP)